MIEKLLARIPFKKTIIAGLSVLVLGWNGCSEGLGGLYSRDAGIERVNDGGEELGRSDGGCSDKTYYQDADSDGFGNLLISLEACVQPSGYVLNNTDCDDSNPKIHPYAPERCNGKDDNCNGMIDEGFNVGQTCYKGIGECQTEGIYICSANGLETLCNAVPRQPALVGYWNFDEDSGNIAYDSSGYGNHGDINGATWTIGKVNSALNFDGINDSVIILDNPILRPGNITLSVWVLPYLPYTQSPSDTNGYMEIISKFDGDSYDLHVLHPALYCFCVSSNFTHAAEGHNTELIERQWQHVAVTSDGTFGAIYINSVLKFRDQYHFPPDPDGMRYNDTPLLAIGAFTDGRQMPFRGKIDEVKIYDCVLSAEQIREEYNRGMNP